MSTATAHRNDDLEDLRARAVDVATSPSVRRGGMSASEAAHCLTGVMSWLQHRTSMNHMQEMAAALARHDPAWTSSFGKLPVRSDGTVDESIVLMATVCRGLIELAGVQNLRAAVSFWATESDPAQWRRLFAE